MPSALSSEHVFGNAIVVDKATRGAAGRSSGWIAMGGGETSSLGAGPSAGFPGAAAQDSEIPARNRYVLGREGKKFVVWTVIIASYYGGPGRFRNCAVVAFACEQTVPTGFAKGLNAQDIFYLTGRARATQGAEPTRAPQGESLFMINPRPPKDTDAI